MLAQIKPNLANMTEKLQANDVQRRQPVVVRCCLKVLPKILGAFGCLSISSSRGFKASCTSFGKFFANPRYGIKTVAVSIIRHSRMILQSVRRIVISIRIHLFIVSATQSNQRSQPESKQTKVPETAFLSDETISDDTLCPCAPFLQDETASYWQTAPSQ